MAAGSEAQVEPMIVVLLYLASLWLGISAHEAQLDGETRTASFVATWAVVCCLFATAMLVKLASEFIP